MDLQFVCQQFQQFDPNFMLTQVHELSELLFKVKSGKINEDGQGELFDEDDYGNYPDWDDNFSHGSAENQKQSTKTTDEGFFGSA